MKRKAFWDATHNTGRQTLYLMIVGVMTIGWLTYYIPFIWRVKQITHLRFELLCYNHNLNAIQSRYHKCTGYVLMKHDHAI